MPEHFKGPMGKSSISWQRRVAIEGRSAIEKACKRESNGVGSGRKRIDWLSAAWNGRWTGFRAEASATHDDTMPPKSLWSTPSTYAQSFGGGKPMPDIYTHNRPALWPAFWNVPASAMRRLALHGWIFLPLYYLWRGRVVLAAQLDMLDSLSSPTERPVQLTLPTGMDEERKKLRRRWGIDRGVRLTVSS